MPYNLSVPETIARDIAYWLPYAAFFDCNLVDDLPAAFSQGPDSLEIIPASWPYPSSGINLGIIDGGISIKKASQLEDRPPDGLEVVSKDRFFKSYQRTIEFTLLSSGRRAVADIFDDPGPRTSVDSYGGGEIAATDHNLVIMLRDLYHPDNFLCLIHFNVSPLPADEFFGAGEPLKIQAIFKCYAGADPSDANCYRASGTQIWRKVYINSAGQLIDPDTGSTIDNNANNTAYPAISMGGGMIGG